MEKIELDEVEAFFISLLPCENFFVVLMAVVNSNYRFVYTDVGAYGKDCDFCVPKD
jgi:hypothetical protein